MAWEFKTAFFTLLRRSVILGCHLVLAGVFIFVLTGIEWICGRFGDPVLLQLTSPQWEIHVSHLFRLMDVAIFVVFLWKGIEEMWKDF